MRTFMDTNEEYKIGYYENTFDDLEQKSELPNKIPEFKTLIAKY